MIFNSFLVDKDTILFFFESLASRSVINKQIELYDILYNKLLS